MTIRYIAFGGVEKHLSKDTVIKFLNDNCQIATWPETPLGYNFSNGAVLINAEGNPQLYPHNPQFNFRNCLSFPFDANAKLIPLDIAWLSDLSNNQGYNLNILRFLLFSVLKPGTGNVGFFLNGEPGRAKSTISNLLTSWLGHSAASTVNPKDLS